MVKCPFVILNWYLYICIMKNAIRTYICQGCGKVVTKSCVKNIQYCSTQCYHKHGKTGRKKNGKYITCIVCGNNFYAPASRKDKAITCSSACQKIWQSRKIETKCETCGKTYKLSPSRFKFDNPRFCSLKCRNNNKSVKERLIEMNRKQQYIKITSIEKIGYSVLDNANINYFPQKVMFDRFCVDAYIPVDNIVIQFDGDYWHGNPDKYTILDKRQIKRRALDKSQDAYMKKRGITILRFWGSQIIKNPNIILSNLSTVS